MEGRVTINLEISPVPAKTTTREVAAKKSMKSARQSLSEQNATGMKSPGPLGHALEGPNKIITPKATDVVSLPATTH